MYLENCIEDTPSLALVEFIYMSCCHFHDSQVIPNRPHEKMASGISPTEGCVTVTWE